MKLLRAVIAATVLGVALMFLLPSSRADPLPEAVPLDAEVARGIYLSDCAVCHGADARGTDRGPSLARYGRAGVDYSLTTGRMPLVAAGRTPAPERERPIVPLPRVQLPEPDLSVERHDPAYPPETISALVDYVASLTGQRAPDIPQLRPGNITVGGELYRLQCAACHSWSGDGGALLHREAPPLHSATRLQTAEAVRVGPGQMPAFGTAALTDDQLNAVVEYVQYLKHPRDRGGDALAHLGPFAEGAVALLALGVLIVLTTWIGERG